MKRKHLLFKEAVCKNRISLIKLFVNRNNLSGESNYSVMQLYLSLAKALACFFVLFSPSKQQQKWRNEENWYQQP